MKNIIINGHFVKDTDANTLFGDEDVHYTDETDISRLMVELGLYKSTSKARAAGRVGVVTSGFTDKFKATKKTVLWIWNPSE